MTLALTLLQQGVEFRSKLLAYWHRVSGFYYIFITLIAAVLLWRSILGIAVNFGTPFIFNKSVIMKFFSP